MLRNKKQPKQLVENRTSFAGPNSEFSIYDTYQAAQSVPLKANELLFCGMISGTKVIHQPQQKLPGDSQKPQTFLPHESFIIAPQQNIEIDFPEATLEQPTTCLTVEISREKVSQISQQLQLEFLQKSDFNLWQQEKTLHLQHSIETQMLLERLSSVFIENHQDRNFLIDLGISELVMRLLRHKNAAFLISHSQQQPDHSGLTAAIQHIEHNLEQPIDIEKLSRISCMSRSHLFKIFRNQLDMTPCEFQKVLRLNKAKQLLGKGVRVTDVCFSLGFLNPSHFSRSFKSSFGISPKAFQKQLS